MRRTSTLERLKSVLTSAMKQRARRSDVGGGSEPGWVAYERQVMVDGTRARLAELGVPVDERALLQAVTLAEDSACGHVDYVAKWALGCAEYVALTAEGAVNG